MEFADFVKKFFKFWPVLAGLTILGGVSGGIFNTSQTPLYTATVTVYLSQISDQQKTFATANEFTDTVLGILTTTDLENTANFEVKKLSPQLIQLRIKTKDANQTSSLAESLPGSLQNSLEKVLGTGKIEVLPIASKIESYNLEKFRLLNIAVGFAVGFVAGTALSSLIIYFRT